MTRHSVLPDLTLRIETALVDHLIQDPGVRTVLGDPPRLFVNWPRRAPFPYAVIDRHEQKPLRASGSASWEHRIDLAVYTRHGGRAEARDCLGALQAAFEAAPLIVERAHIVLAHVVYADIMRTANLNAFRGLMRLRLVTEADQ
ncbi:MAG: DUF3168 domain-containing protein [Pseudomonadota bacterium]